MASKSKNTNQKYIGYFNKFDVWCGEHGFISLPAKVTTVCLFLSDLTISEVSNSVLEGYFYAINWKHELSLFDNPCAHKLTKLTFDGSRRILCQPKRKKQPVTADILNRIVNLYSNGGKMNFKDNRLCTMCILGFSGFLRFSELSSLQMKDIKIYENHMSLFIKKSKTDQLQKGSEIVIAKTGNKLCPVSWLKNYLAAASLTVSSDEYIFTKVKFLKSKNKYVPVNTLSPLSYTRSREIFLQAIVAIGEDKNKFGLHSLRSGGASACANSTLNLDTSLLNKHGRWKSSTSSDGYIHYNLNKRLQISKHLGI
jgi:integrase